ncbi:MAG: Heavy-metal-associated domain [Candidatus Parcubacteria bacterium]|jgi:copper chaperone CopZ
MITTVIIRGMHCASCKSLIEEVAMETAGVRSCAVDLQSGRGTIDHDETFDFEAFAKEIRTLGPYHMDKV